MNGWSAREEALKAAAGVIRATPEEVPAAHQCADGKSASGSKRNWPEAKKALALGGGGSGGAAASADEETRRHHPSAGRCLKDLIPRNCVPCSMRARRGSVRAWRRPIAVNDGQGQHRRSGLTD